MTQPSFLAIHSLNVLWGKALSHNMNQLHGLIFWPNSTDYLQQMLHDTQIVLLTDSFTFSNEFTMNAFQIIKTNQQCPHLWLSRNAFFFFAFGGPSNFHDVPWHILETHLSLVTAEPNNMDIPLVVLITSLQYSMHAFSWPSVSLCGTIKCIFFC